MNEEIVLKTVPLSGSVEKYLPFEIIVVNDKDKLELMWNQMIQQYHYLGYQNMIGPRIKYLAAYHGVPIAALSFNRASLRVQARDTFIGYDEDGKKIFLKHVVCNNRFLILPWIKIKNLASYLLSQTLKRLKNDWFKMYGIRPLLVETYVDISFYKSTCYKAANWIHIGETKGFSKLGKSFVYHGNKKAVYLYILGRDYKKFVPKPLRQPPKKREKGPKMILNIPDWNPTILDDAGITTEEILQLGEMLENYLSIYRNCYGHAGQQRNCEGFINGIAVLL